MDELVGWERKDGGVKLMSFFCASFCFSGEGRILILMLRLDRVEMNGVQVRWALIIDVDF